MTLRVLHIDDDADLAGRVISRDALPRESGRTDAVMGGARVGVASSMRRPATAGSAPATR